MAVNMAGEACSVGGWKNVQSCTCIGIVIYKKHCGAIPTLFGCFFGGFYPYIFFHFVTCFFDIL